jgi:UDP-N-acetyl-D-glucosamine dehydrogenase
LRFTPSLGVGGHCLPIDPSYLSWQVKRTFGHSFRFVELANDVNDHMPDYVVQRLTELLNRDRKAVNGSNILLLGLAYKKGTSDARESPSVRIARLLAARGADIRFADPLVDLSVVQLHEPLPARQVPPTKAEVGEADLDVLFVDHDEFDLDLLSSAVVLDARRTRCDQRWEAL